MLRNAWLNEVATAYGLTNLFWVIGGIFGLIAETYGWVTFFHTLSVTAFLCALPSLFLGESAKKLESKVEETNDNRVFKRGFASVLAVFFAIHILGNTARAILGTIFPFYLTESFNKSKAEAGLFFAFSFGIAALIAQIPSGLLTDKFGGKRVKIYSASAIPFLSILFIFVSDYLSILFVYRGITGSWSVTWPASLAYLIGISTTSRRGTMMDIRLTAVRLGFTVGPLIGGFLWDIYNPMVSFGVSAFLFASSSILTLRLRG